MKLKVRQMVSASRWKRELACNVFITIFLLGIGVPLFLDGTSGEPKYRPGNELAIPARAVVLLLSGMFVCAAAYAVYQALMTVRNRHKRIEVEFVLDDVTSCEPVPDSSEHSC